MVKMLALDIAHKLLDQSLSYLPCFVGIIDFYHFIPLAGADTVAGGVKVSEKQSVLASFSHALYNKIYFCAETNQFKLNFLIF